MNIYIIFIYPRLVWKLHDSDVEINWNSAMYVMIEGKNNITRARLSSALVRCGAVICHPAFQYNGRDIVNDNLNIVLVLDNDSVEKCREFLNKSTINQLDIINLSDSSVSIDRGREHFLSKDILQQAEGVRLLVDFVCKIYYQHYCLTSNNKDVQYNDKILKSAATSMASILIQGESGTGKERVAKFIHYNSLHHDGPYITVNCAAIPDAMLEAVLFGYEKGAFTNAINQHIGKFERANNGTILLDEIGEMSLEMQSKLLRVLEEQEIERIGGKGPISLQFRLLASTNKDLSNQVVDGKFRLDLLYRLNVITTNCVPLRNRMEDLKSLVTYLYHYYMQINSINSLIVSEDIYPVLSNYNWPGNIRELENKIHRSIIVCENNTVTLNDFELENKQNFGTDFGSDLKSREAQIIYNALVETNGSRSIVAKKLNISPRTLRAKISKMKDIGMDVP